MVWKIHDICKSYKKPLIILGGINRLTEDMMIDWNNGFKGTPCEVIDLVSNYGIEMSMKKTAACIEDITDKTLLPKIKEFL